MAVGRFGRRRTACVLLLSTVSISVVIHHPPPGPVSTPLSTKLPDGGVTGITVLYAIFLGDEEFVDVGYFRFGSLILVTIVRCWRVFFNTPCWHRF